MGEFIHDVQEKIEAVYGQVLESRQKTLSHFSGLGPPDLCVLIKSYDPPRFVPGLKHQMYSSYHWVMGVDTSSTSSIAVYLGSIIDKQEKSSFGRGSYKIEGCHFCIYNAFLKMDLHVELGINNSQPTVYSVGESGERNTVEESFWKETYISSVLRSVSPPPPFLRPLKILPSLKDQFEESNFLLLCNQHFWHGRKLGGYDGEFIDIKNQDSEGFESDDTNNLLVTALVDYFVSRNRYEPIVGFFEEFIETEPTISVVVAKAMMLMNQSSQAIDLLTTSLEKVPNSTSILMALSEILLFQYNKSNNNNNNNNGSNTTSSNSPSTNISSSSSPSLPASTATTTTVVSTPSTPKHNTLLLALKYVLKSISLKPLLVKHWKIAANILSQMGHLEWSLIFLNNAPYLKSEVAIDRIGKSTYARVTPPPDHPNIVTVLEDEELEFDEEPGDDFLKRLTSQSLYGESKEIFDMLITMYRNIGWLELAGRKTRVLDHLAQTARGKQSSPLQQQPSPPPKQQTNVNNDATITTKDGHNISSPTNRSKATENSTDTDGGSTADEPVIPPESNVPKEGLWQEEDVTSEGSDIQDLDEEKDISLNDSTTSTNPDVKPKKVRVKFDQDTLTSQEATAIKDVLEQFIIHYGATSNKPKSSDYIDIDTPSFKARLPVLEIHRNLELAFHALFQDYKAYQTWKDEDQSKNALDGANNLKQLNPTRSFADWIRIGLLSKRLGEMVDAEKLFKLISHEKFHPKVIGGLVEIFERVGDIRNCLISSSTLSKYYTEKVKVQEINPTVEKSILNLISLFGLQKVRSIHSTINDLSSVIGDLYLDSVKWRSFGFDR